MNYKLAKQLKDAGFLQEGKGDYVEDPECPATKNIKAECNCDGVVYAPILSELIEACGDDFMELKRGANASQFGGWWEAKSWDEKEARGLTNIGCTPEEAVAKLWLEIIKQNLLVDKITT